jgi:hypothetical protein
MELSVERVAGRGSQLPIADIRDKPQLVAMSQRTTVASASGSTRPLGDTRSTKMLGTKPPFDSCGKLGLLSATVIL